MAGAQGGDADGPNTPNELPQHPLVERLKPDPKQVARKVVTLVGLPGKSDRAGYQRLYLTPKLDYYAEFPFSAMVHTETVPAGQSTIANQEATRVTLARDATIQYIWASTPQAVHDFDLDVRLVAQGAAAATFAVAAPNTIALTPCETCFESCGGSCVTCGVTQCNPNTCAGNTCVTCFDTCNTCQTRCNQQTCNTCQTQCNQQTCANTCNTCQTQCNQQTCNTCQTQCNQQTCNTCQTQCNQQTCVHTQCNQGTCQTCHNQTCQTCLDPATGCRC